MSFDAKELFNKISRAAKVAELAALNELLADTSERIFEDGKAADGSKIGTYSERPWNASEELGDLKGQVPISKLRGQTFFKGGYKELRGKLGRENQFVNLDLTGSLRLIEQSRADKRQYGCRNRWKRRSPEGSGQRKTL